MAKSIQKESHTWNFHIRIVLVALLALPLTGDAPVTVNAKCKVPNAKAVVGESNAVDKTPSDHCK